MINYRCLWAKVFLLFLFLPTHAQSLSVKTGNTWAGIFSGEIVHHEIILTGKKNSHASLNWWLKSKGRTLSSGQMNVRFNSSNVLTATLPLKTPSMKPGIKLQALLIIEVENEAAVDKKVHYESKLIVYGPDLLQENRHFFKQLNIQLFDPVGNTSKIFDKLKIPYQVRSKSQLINSSRNGLVVVGAGVALDQQRGLIDTLIEQASSGKHVLILGPIAGDIPISGLTTNANAQPSAMSFMDDSAVQFFAKDYDWIDDGSIKKHGISLLNHRETILARIVKHNKTNWDWLHINFDQSRGKIIICMLPFERYIDHGPVPQIIFSRLLAYANGQLAGLTAQTQGK